MSTRAGPQEHTPAEHAEARRHATPRDYVTVALVLGIVTVAEVWVAYVEELRSLLVPILFVLSATKFSLVALFYMHLRYDSRLFSALFVAGIGLTAAILLALLALFGLLV
jgi:cytochrome c oxidase subunit 4